MFVLLGFVAAAYILVKGIAPAPVHPEPLEMDDYDVYEEIDEDGGIFGKLFPAEESSDDSDRYSDDFSEEDDDGSDEASNNDDNSEGADEETSSFEMLSDDEEEEKPSEEISEDAAEKKSEDDDKEKENDEDGGEQSEASEEEEQPLWTTAKGCGLEAFFDEVKQDLTSKELLVAEIVHRRLKRNMKWSCMDTVWQAIMGRDAPVDILKLGVCPERVRVRFYTPWVLEGYEGRAPSELEFTRCIRRWTRKTE